MVDERAGIDIDIAIRCFGEYSYRLSDPILFYTNVCGNVAYQYKRSELDSQLKSELLTALQPAFAKISAMGIRYSALPGHTTEMADALNEVLSEKWSGLRGIEIVSFGVSSVKADEEDEKMIKEMQRNAAFMDPTRAAAHMVGAQAAAMQAAAANEGAGPAMAFMGMGMAQNMGGVNAANLYQMGQQQAQMGVPNPQAVEAAKDPRNAMPVPEGWTCSCGKSGITSNFCPQCGKSKPAPAETWDCECGKTGITSKFCPECGKSKPAPAELWNCECGAKGIKSKFCPECGKPKPADDTWDCSCGVKGIKTKFCPECGKPKA